MLAQHPDVQRQAREEAMAVTEEEMESGSFLVKLPYLGAVIKETLRLYPAVRSIPGRVTTRKIKLKSNGLEVPAGVALTSPSWVTARMVSVWGPDAREFNPSRFYRRSYDTKTGASTSPGGDESTRGTVKPKPSKPKPISASGSDVWGPLDGKYTVFGAGVRSCIGKNLSVLEMKTVLLLILRTFRLGKARNETVEGASKRHWQLEPPFMKTKPGYCVTLTLIPGTKAEDKSSASTDSHSDVQVG